MRLHSEQRKVDSMEGYSEGQILEFKNHMQQQYDDQLKQITVMVPFVSIFSDIHHHFILMFNLIF
jgi:hypothetical protein